MKRFVPDKTEYSSQYPIPEVTVPEGFVDFTWFNDASPSMFSEQFDLRIWVNYLNKEDREWNVDYLFAVSSDLYPRTWHSSNDWEEILEFVETMKEDIRYADAFSAVIRSCLTEAELEEVNRRNRFQLDHNICHSHDFCDANQAFIDAMEAKGVDPFSFSTGRHNRIWELAKIYKFEQIETKEE